MTVVVPTEDGAAGEVDTDNGTGSIPNGESPAPAQASNNSAGATVAADTSSQPAPAEASADSPSKEEEALRYKLNEAALGTTVENHLPLGLRIGAILLVIGLVLWRVGLVPGLFSLLVIVAGIAAPAVGLLVIKGACPHCHAAITTLNTKTRLRCDACGQDILVGNEKFYRVKDE